MQDLKLETASGIESQRSSLKGKSSAHTIYKRDNTRGLGCISRRASSIAGAQRQCRFLSSYDADRSFRGAFGVY